MERPERTEKDDSQKAKLIFLSLAALVTILLIWSFVSANTARKERDAARQETDLLKQDNLKLEQLLKEQSLANDEIKKQLASCEAKAKAKPKPAAKKKAPASKSTSKKTSRSKKTR
jgi:regulatory protein YycI of two-component signal transduction system YycFG